VERITLHPPLHGHVFQASEHLRDVGDEGAVEAASGLGTDARRQAGLYGTGPRLLGEDEESAQSS
jgi:hypothetical protein